MLGREEGGGATRPRDGCREDTLLCLSAALLRAAAEYGLADSSLDLRAELPKMIGPPYRS